MQRLQPGSPSTDHGLTHTWQRPGTRALLIGLTLTLAACGQPASPAAVPDPLAAGTGLLDSTLAGTTFSAQRLRSTDFGPNVRVFDPGMKVADIQAAVDAVYAQQVSNQFGPQRNTFLFRPGSYGTAAQPLMVKVGYYTEVAGLGASPTDVTINGHVDVFNQCLDGGGTSNCVALVNFWRTASNLTVHLSNPTGYDGCRGSGNFWAVSQAAPLRRFNMTGGNLTLMVLATS